MKRSFATTALLMVSMAGAAAAQGPEPAPGMFQTGSTYAGPRVWLGNLNGAVAIGGQVERGITRANDYGPGIISGGVGVDWYTWSYSYPLVGKYSYTVVPIQAFSNYHFAIASNPKIDPYLGLSLVYSVVSASWSGNGVGQTGAQASSLGFAGQGGVRYFISPAFAVSGQVGFGYGTLGVGTSWRF